MKKTNTMQKHLRLRLTAVLLMLCMITGLAQTVLAVYPSHTNYIHDGADILSDSLIETVKSTNDSLYAKVKARISVCIVESLGGEAIHTYSRNLFTEWKLGEGVLLVISTGDENYFAVQSSKIDHILTNERLDQILKEFMEPDFAEGNVARGLQKTVNKLASFLKSELPAAEADESKPSDSVPAIDDEKVSVGSILLSVLKIIGLTLLVLVVAFVVFFVIALFNDTAAELMNRHVFSHFTGKKSASARYDYYDERIYGGSQNSQRRPQNGRPAPSQRPQQQGRPGQNGRQMYNRYQQGGVRYDDEYYGSRSTANRSRPNTQGKQNTPRQSNPDYEYTRQFSINNRKDN